MISSCRWLCAMSVHRSRCIPTGKLRADVLSLLPEIPRGGPWALAVHALMATTVPCRVYKHPYRPHRLGCTATAATGVCCHAPATGTTTANQVRLGLERQCHLICDSNYLRGPACASRPIWRACASRASFRPHRVCCGPIWTMPHLIISTPGPLWCQK